MSETTNRLTQLVVFRIQANEYALVLEDVVEVLRMVAITPVPEAPPWLPGLINLRGQIIPVVDLRTRLGFPPQAPGLNTPIIVATSAGRLLGLIADSMIDMLSLPSECIEQPGTLAGSTQVLSAIAHTGERIIMLLDLQALWPDQDGW